MSTAENSADGQNIDRKRGLSNSSTGGGPSTEDLSSPSEGELKTERELECTGNNLGHSRKGNSRRKTVLFNYVPRHHSPGKSTEDARCLLRRKEEPANVCNVNVLAGTSSAGGETTVTRECSLHGGDPAPSETEPPEEKSSDSEQKHVSNGGKVSDMPGVSNGDDKEPRGASPLDALTLLADVGVSMQKIPRGYHGNNLVSDDTEVIETFVKTAQEGRDKHEDGISIRPGVSKTISATGTQDSNNTPHSSQTAIQNTTEYSKGSYQQCQQLTVLSTPPNTSNPTFLNLSRQSESDKKQGTSTKRKSLCTQKSTATGKKQKTAALSMNAAKDGVQNVVYKACPVLSAESPLRTENRLSFTEPRTTADRHRMVLILYTPQSNSEVPTIATQEQDENVRID